MEFIESFEEFELNEAILSIDLFKIKPAYKIINDMVNNDVNSMIKSNPELVSQIIAGKSDYATVENDLKGTRDKHEITGWYVMLIMEVIKKIKN